MPLGIRERVVDGEQRCAWNPNQCMDNAFDLIIHAVIDQSASMKGSKLQQAKDGGLKLAADAMEKEYAVGLIAFGSTTAFMCAPVRKEKEFAECLAKIEIETTTNMTAGLELATERLEVEKGSRVIVIVTDGKADNPGSSLEVARKAKNQGIKIIAIGTDDADEEFLRKLASDTMSMKVSSEHLAFSIASVSRLLLPAPDR